MYKVKRKIEQMVDVYIADDGMEFYQDEMACFKYELLLRKDIVIREAEKLRIGSLDGLAPIGFNSECSISDTYAWYLLKNMDEYDVVNRAYDEKFPAPEVFPEIICVRTADENIYASPAKGYLLSAMRDVTVRFWNTLGYEASIRK